MKEWRCTVCGYLSVGEAPPKECPQCHGDSDEFAEVTKEKKLEAKECDVLLINGSSHRGHNTSALCDMAEEELKNLKANYMRVNLGEHKIDHCWCCYSMVDWACTYPCRNPHDDMHVMHEMIEKSKAVIIASPINWNGMSARLKDFLDRTTCLENLGSAGQKSLTAGKVFGVLINGHEDGAVKTAMDIFLYFQQMGFVMAPFGFAYATRGAGHGTNTDNEFYKKNERLKKNVSAVVSNVMETVNQGLEKKLKDKITPVCE